MNGDGQFEGNHCMHIACEMILKRARVDNSGRIKTTSLNTVMRYYPWGPSSHIPLARTYQRYEPVLTWRKPQTLNVCCSFRSISRCIHRLFLKLQSAFMQSGYWSLELSSRNREYVHGENRSLLFHLLSHLTKVIRWLKFHSDNQMKFAPNTMATEEMCLEARLAVSYHASLLDRMSRLQKEIENSNRHLEQLFSSQKPELSKEQKFNELPQDVKTEITRISLAYQGKL